MSDLRRVAMGFDRACRRAGVRYVLVGGFAVMAWGRARATEDLDALVDLPVDRIGAFVTALGGEGLAAREEDFRASLVDPGHVTVHDPGSVFHVDIKMARNREERAEIDRGQEIEVEGGPVRVATPEDTVAFKVLYGTPQDLEDARSILLRMKGRLDEAALDRVAGSLGVARTVGRLRRETNR